MVAHPIDEKAWCMSTIIWAPYNSPSGLNQSLDGLLVIPSRVARHFGLDPGVTERRVGYFGHSLPPRLVPREILRNHHEHTLLVFQVAEVALPWGGLPESPLSPPSIHGDIGSDQGVTGREEFEGSATVMKATSVAHRTPKSLSEESCVE